MKKILLTLSILFLSTLGFSQTLMPLPTHTTVYQGIFARGYWFTAPSDFDIVGLRVAAEAGTGDQYIHVVRFTGIPTTSTTGASNFTTLAYISAAPNGVIQPVNLPIATGDVIGILGTVGNIQNSYGSGGFSTTVNGASTTLYRLGYQGSINGGPAPNMWGVTGGSMGRIEMYWDLPVSAPNDAGVFRIAQPGDTCTGQYDVEVEVKNYGTNQITSGVTINWSYNGIIQTPTTYNGILDTANGTGASSAIVNLGTVNLNVSAFNDIVAWTSMPNGVNDTVTRNDSASASVFGFPFPTINLGPDITECPGVAVVLQGGSTRDSLRWSNNTTNDSIVLVNGVGQYHVTVWENGCASSDTINISRHPKSSRSGSWT